MRMIIRGYALHELLYEAFKICTYKLVCSLYCLAGQNGCPVEKEKSFSMKIQHYCKETAAFIVEVKLDYMVARNS